MKPKIKNHTPFTVCS